MTAKRAELFIKGEKEMVHFGGLLCDACDGNEVIYLHGELGAGKTTMVRGFIHQLGHTGAVKSPTYTLVEHYSYNNKTVYHFDLYRLGEAEELEYMGIRDYFHRKAVSLIEWPEKGRGYLPKADIDIKIYYEHEGQRRLHFEAVSRRGVQIFNGLSGLYSAFK